MKGDFSRDTFDPAKHYSGVLMQQGRVQIDADWNEQDAILLHYLRTLAADILGPHAGPPDAMGFTIVTRNTASALAKIDDFEPDPARAKVLKAACEEGNLVIAPGRYYVHGMLVENERGVLLSEQPGHPLDERLMIEDFKAPFGELVYLDVTERYVTAIEDPALREVALGGPDTSGRAQVVWQVRILEFERTDKPFDCNVITRRPSTGTGKLRARARLDEAPTESGGTPSGSPFRGTENRLYRVEVHNGGSATDAVARASFKWSRENGSVTFPIRSLSGTTAKLGNLGRDARWSIAPGDWVELVDDAVAMRDEAGPLLQVRAVDRDNLTVTFSPPKGLPSWPDYTEASASARHALLRRWDQAGKAEASGGTLPITEQAATPDGQETGWIALEDGVEVWFAAGGEYRAGDYWLIPARTATGDVEWPDEVDSKDNLVPALRPAHGPHHYFAPLLMVTADARGTIVETDCRRVIPQQKP
jgi:hypothetical protein